MMTVKRPSENVLSGILRKKKIQDRKNVNLKSHAKTKPFCPFLSNPVIPEKAISIFLTQARTTLLKGVSAGTDFSTTKHSAEIETRIGILKTSYPGHRDMRVLSFGPKTVESKGEIFISNAFICSTLPQTSLSQTLPHHSVIPHYQFENGVTRAHFTKWTGSGISESNCISKAFGIHENNIDSITLSRKLVETETSEVVFIGYPQSNQRLCVVGSSTHGRMEKKSKMDLMDVSLPSAPYDIRLTLSSEKIVDPHVPADPPPSGWTYKRTKRRRSYTRRDKSFAWRLDVTETITVENEHNLPISSRLSIVKPQYEIELELERSHMLKLISEKDDIRAKTFIEELARQLWWMLLQINPSPEILNAHNFLRDHNNKKEVSLAIAHCVALKSYSDNYARANKNVRWSPAISKLRRYITNNNNFNNASSDRVEKKPLNTKRLENLRFAGCMPVNFSRHHIEKVQGTCVDGKNCEYFLSEKTDGLRHLLVFTGKSAVLIDRTMNGKQPSLSSTGIRLMNNEENTDPMSHILPLIRSGTVLDGEVVVHRKLRRPVFIVFDILSVSSMKPVLHLPFAHRLKYIHEESFREEGAEENIFSDSSASTLKNSKALLPLIRKVFVRRCALDDILSHVTEEKGIRCYRYGNGVYDHLTDGIIFQPNTPYVCGTDINLLKWKYLDTVTIDVELIDTIPLNVFDYPKELTDNHVVRSDSSTQRFGMLGDGGSIIDMTRHIRLNPKEFLRLEADRYALNYKTRIVEIGFDPLIGEWFYGTFRPDKTQPNHVSTVMASFLELAERLDVDELRYRMMINSQMGIRDLYHRDIKKMKKQLLDYQRKKYLTRTTN